MPSIALQVWQSRGRQALDEVEAAHAAVGGAGRGRRYATQQINQAYVVLLCSQFQKFCRDLHTEGVDHLTSQPAFMPLAMLLNTSIIVGRKLSVGNASPGNIGADFARFGFRFWDEVLRRDRRNGGRQAKLDELVRWRNAIAHQDFTSPMLAGRETLRLSEVRAWRSVCESLAVEFDRVLGLYLLSITGVRPW
ncbi:MAG TPA: hypothetical protein VF746_26485 [Longimicrobium sp.]|jgi:hypothetical protein